MKWKFLTARFTLAPHLLNFSTDIPEGARYGGPTAKMLQMSRNQLLLAGDLDNSHNPDLKVAPNKDIGFTFKLRNLKKKFLKSLVKEKVDQSDIPSCSSSMIN